MNIYQSIKQSFCALLLLANTHAVSASGTLPSQPEGGYLFAHMRHEDYGRLYYSISKDAIHWTRLYHNRRIVEDYKGHPDIIKGKDNRYYMIGVDENKQLPVLWCSNDLIEWHIEKELPLSPFLLTDNYYTERNWFGAPKLFYDQDSQQYLISWHASLRGTKGNDEWKSMRTFYVLTSDFEHFSMPKRLFHFSNEADQDIATIDAIVRKIGKYYYAVIKDERWPEDGVATGKSIRIAKSRQLTGPYRWIHPTQTVTTPYTYYEAPVLVPRNGNKGWMIFSERYPHEYVRFDAPDIEARKWNEHPSRIEDARHGVIVPLTETQYQNILSHFQP